MNLFLCLFVQDHFIYALQSMNKIKLPNENLIDNNNNNNNQDSHLEEQPTTTELTSLPGVSSTFLIPNDES